MGFKIATSCGSVHPPHMTNISKKVRHAYHQDQPRRTMELVFKSDTPPAATRILKLALGMYVDRNTSIKSISRSCVSKLLESILSYPLLSYNKLQQKSFGVWRNEWMFVVKAKHVRILESLDYVTRVANQTCIDEPCLPRWTNRSYR